MFILRSLLAGVLGLAVVLPAIAAQEAGTTALSGPATVIDGDTIDVANTRIRLGGIDAPERSETCTHSSGAQWSCGRWAWFEAERLLQGRYLQCADLGARSHARVVARCTLDGEDVAALLIRAGVARVCDRFADAQGVLHTYRTAEAQARAIGRGIFGGPMNAAAGFCALRISAAGGAVGTHGAACRIKGNVSSNGRIYHLPGQAHYERVDMDDPRKRWFCSEAEAQAAGWRPAQR